MLAECIQAIHTHALKHREYRLADQTEKLGVNVSVIPRLQRVCPEYHVAPTTAMVDLSPSERFSFYLMGILGSATVFLGLVVNILALTHLTIYKNNLGPRYGYIIGMSIWDNCLLLSGWVTLSLSVLIGRGHVVTHGHLVLISKYGHVIMNVSMLGVIWSTTAITIERYFAICRPSRHAIKRTMRRSRWWFPVTVVLFSLYNFPRFFEIAVAFCCDIDTLSLVPLADVASFAKPGTLYFLWYKTVANALVVTIGPFCLLTFLTIRIIIRIQSTKRPGMDSMMLLDRTERTFSQCDSQSTQYSCNPDGSGRRHGYVNRSLILIVIKFVICHTLCTVNDLIQCIVGPDWLNHIPWFIYFVEIGDYLILAHSSTSGLIFLLLSRRTLLRGKPQDAGNDRPKANDTMASVVPPQVVTPPLRSVRVAAVKCSEPTKADFNMSSVKV